MQTLWGVRISHPLFMRRCRIRPYRFCLSTFNDWLGTCIVPWRTLCYHFFFSWVLLHGRYWFVRCGVSANTHVGTCFGTRNDSCTCTAWGSSEAFVCLFVAVFLLRLWFNQFWGVSLTDPLTPA